MLKNFLLVTKNNRRVVVRAKSDEAAKYILENHSNEKLKSIRKLKLTDLIDSDEVFFLED
ncbi:hypothetical protein [Niallia sp. MER 6]|uniref:hypothetical protein n=1 Tax=Niallia sp. MER 6 TaxID=2939567 RepID=UPI00203B0E96|nr:hypothetical protein [Niallia sp. MER 6]MCM3032598.1 hypothetical protein [Niallia sp. MER 6]